MNRREMFKRFAGVAAAAVAAPRVEAAPRRLETIGFTDFSSGEITTGSIVVVSSWSRECLRNEWQWIPTR